MVLNTGGGLPAPGNSERDDTMDNSKPQTNQRPPDAPAAQPGGKRLPSVSSLSPSAITRKGQRVRKPLRPVS
jgi:hypothetical protein